MKKHMIHVLELTFAHTTKIEHAPQSTNQTLVAQPGSQRANGRGRPTGAGAAHTKYSRYVCPKSWRKLAFSRKEMCAVRPAGPKVSLLAAGGWRVARAAPHAQQDFGRRFAAAWGAGAAGVWSRVIPQAGPGRPVAPAQRRRPMSMCVSRVTCGRVCQRVCTGGVADGGVELLR